MIISSKKGIHSTIGERASYSQTSRNNFYLMCQNTPNVSISDTFAINTSLNLRSFNEPSDVRKYNSFSATDMPADFSSALTCSIAEINNNPAVMYSVPSTLGDILKYAYYDGSVWTYVDTGMVLYPRSIYMAFSNIGDQIISRNTGTNWTYTAPLSSHAFSEAACSVDGTIIYGVKATSTQNIYVSRDSGNTWGTLTGFLSAIWTHIACSYDGKRIVATTNTLVYISGNGGLTTSSISLGTVTSVSMSSSGKYILVCSGAGGSYLSNDYGNTFSVNLGIGYTGAVSEDGKYIVRVASAILSLSSDYGISWVNKDTYIFQGVETCISADGSKIYSLRDDGGLRYSFNYGSTWGNSSTTFSNPRKMRCSADGTNIIISSNTAGGTVYFSYNSGSTWYSVAGGFNGAVCCSPLVDKRFSLKSVNNIPSAAIAGVNGNYLGYWEYFGTGAGVLSLTGSSGKITSVDLQEINGRPFIVFSDVVLASAGATLKSTSYDGIVWTEKTIETNANAFNVLDINLLEINGLPSACYLYRAPDKYDLNYATFNGTSWTVHTAVYSVASLTAEGGSCAMTEISNSPAIVYSKDSTDIAIYYATTSDGGATWSTSSVAASTNYYYPIKHQIFNVNEAPFILTSDGGTSLRIFRKNATSDTIFDSSDLFRDVSYRKQGLTSVIIENNLYYMMSSGFNQNSVFGARYPRTVANVQPSSICDGFAKYVGGVPAVAYSSLDDSGSVKYLIFNGTSWVFANIVTNLGSAPSSVSLCEIAGNPAVAYITGSTLKYIQYSGGWGVPDTVDTVVSGKISLTSIFGQPAIAYYKNLRLYLATYDGASWTYYDVDSSNISRCKSVLEVEGQPAIAYEGSAGIKYAKYNGVGWDISTVSANTSVSSVVLRKIGSNPVIAINTGAQIIYYTFNGISTWTSSVVGPCNSGELGFEVINDVPFMSCVYTESDNGASKTNAYLFYLDITWKQILVNDYDVQYAFMTNRTDRPDFFVLNNTSLDYIKKDPYIYTNVSQQILSYASNSASLCEVSSYPSVSISDTSTFNLYYKHYNGASWDTTAIPGITNAVYSSDLKIVNSQPAIAFTQLVAGASYSLRYTGYSGSWPTPTTIVASGCAAGSESLADVGGLPVISYISGSLLKLATYNGSWVLTTITISGTPGIKTILLNTGGIPGIFISNNTIGLQFCINGHYEVIGVFPGSYFSAALINGLPAVFIYDTTKAYLFTRSSTTSSVGTWSRETVPMVTLPTTSKISLFDFNGRAAILHLLRLYIRESQGNWSIYQIPTGTGAYSAIKLSSGNIAFTYSETGQTRYNYVSETANYFDSVIYRKGDAYSAYLRNGLDKKLVFSIKQSDNTVKSLYYRPMDRNFNNYGLVGDAGTLTLFVNGQSATSTTYNNTVKENSEALKIGGGGSKVNFLIDDFAIWKSPDFVHTSVQSFISFVQNGNQGRRYEAIRAHWENPITIDSTGNVGTYTSIASVGGKPAIAYYDSTNSSLKYAKKTGDVWTNETVDNTGTLGGFASMVECGNEPWIAYYADTSGAQAGLLKVARYTGGAWTLYTVDGGASYVGTHCNINVVSAKPAVSYYDTTNSNLKYVAWTGTAWGTPDIVDGASPSEAVGLYSSLCEVGGFPAMAYYDTTNKSLKYAQYNGATWDKYVVDSGGASGVGYYASLATLTLGTVPIIAYYDQTNKKLKYAVQGSPGNWTITTLDQPYVGQYCRLIVIDDKPIIAYYDEIYTKIRYLRHDGSAWVPEQFYDISGMGQYCSMANIGGRPHMAFYDTTNTNLMYLASTKHIFTF